MDVFINFAAEVWATLTDMSPYLLFGFLVAGVLGVFLSPAFVERHLGGSGLWPIIKAAVLGVPLPLCSCGVIPVGASLRRHGASRGATASFLLSTPQTGVDSILVTLSLLGPVFAFFRALAAFVIGLVGGAAVEYLGGANGGAVEPVGECEESCCSGNQTSAWRRALVHGFVTLPGDIGKPLLVGLVAAGAISALVPDSFFTELLGSGWWPMVAMLAVGMPVYVCATASVPVAAAMLAKGVAPGAVFVFLMTGPATNAAAIATLWKIMGRRGALIYMGVLAASALVFGAVFDQVVGLADAAAAPVGAAMMPGVVRVGSALALLAILLRGALVREGGTGNGTAVAEPAAGILSLSVEGMSCSHCTGSVQRAIQAVKGVTRAEVTLAPGRAVIEGVDIDADAVVAAVRALGFEARPVSPTDGAEVRS